MPAHQGHPDRTADDRRLGKGGVANAILSKFLQQPFGYLESPAEAADILAQQDYFSVPAHLLAQGQVDRL
jgi:hypothetical protein